MVKACGICQDALPEQPKEPMIPSDVPPRAWHTVGAELFYSKGTEYLLMSDYKLSEVSVCLALDHEMYQRRRHSPA